MITTIQSPHVTLNEQQEIHIYTAMEKIEKILPRAESCNVHVKAIRQENKSILQVEINFQLPGGKLYISERQPTIELALQRIVNKLKRRLIKYRDNQRKKRVHSKKISPYTF